MFGVVYCSVCRFFLFFFSILRQMGKKVLKLTTLFSFQFTTLLRIFLRVVCQFN